MKFKDAVTSLDELRAIVGEPSERAGKKQIDRLDEHCRVVSSRTRRSAARHVDAAGRCDVSPKGDAPGFVQVLDDRTPRDPGSAGQQAARRLMNILENPHVGLLFMVPGRARRCA